jgi:hypothetical protein
MSFQVVGQHPQRTGGGGKLIQGVVQTGARRRVLAEQIIDAVEGSGGRFGKRLDLAVDVSGEVRDISQRCIELLLDRSERALGLVECTVGGGGESLFLRKLVLGIPAQASGKNLTRPLMPSAPRPPCVRAAPPHHRKLGAGYAALPQMARRDCSDAYFVFPLALVPRTTEKQCGLIATGD